MGDTNLVGKAGRAVALLMVALVACGGTSGDPGRFCDLNAELEAFHRGDFLPDDIRREYGESKIVASMQSPLVRFEFDEVDRFASVFGEFVEAAPADIRPSVEELSNLFAPVFAGTDPSGPGMDLEAVVDAFSEEAHAAGFALEEWVADNCSA